MVHKLFCNFESKNIIKLVLQLAYTLHINRRVVALQVECCMIGLAPPEIMGPAIESVSQI